MNTIYNNIRGEVCKIIWKQVCDPIQTQVRYEVFKEVIEIVYKKLHDPVWREVKNDLHNFGM